MKFNYEIYWENRISDGYMPKMPRHYSIVKEILSRKKNGKILDLGCGEGHILKMIPSYFEKYGCDISINALSLNKKNDVNLKKCNLNKDFPFDKKFDIIICSEVIEHLDNYSTLLLNVKKHLLSDGIFFITIPNISNIINLIKKKTSEYDESHVNFWKIEQFKDLIESNNFDIINYYPTYYVPKLIRKIGFFNFIDRFFGRQFLFICHLAK